VEYSKAAVVGAVLKEVQGLNWLLWLLKAWKCTEKTRKFRLLVLGSRTSISQRMASILKSGSMESGLG
jgi:hypothetical protein